MVFGVSSHRAEHWWFMNGGNTFPSDVQDPAYADFYGPAKGQGPTRPSSTTTTRRIEAFLEDWLLRTCELIDKYQPKLIWFDWWIQNMAFKPYLKKFAAYYYNLGASGARAWPSTTSTTPSRGHGRLRHRAWPGASHPGLFWQNDTSVSKNSWGYIDDHDYKVANDIIGDLIDVVSKNGALLLNIGPRADGTIPEDRAGRCCCEIGRWLAGQRRGHLRHPALDESTAKGRPRCAEGAFTDTKRTVFTSEDIRFTTKEGSVYAHVMAWPAEWQGCHPLDGRRFDLSVRQHRRDRTAGTGCQADVGDGR